VKVIAQVTKSSATNAQENDNVPRRSKKAVEASAPKPNVAMAKPSLGCGAAGGTDFLRCRVKLALPE
jgi:hypothetical protein